MYKAVIVSTHGVTVVEGTPIHVYATVARAKGDYSYAFVYDAKGKLDKAYRAEHYNPIEEYFFEVKEEG